VLQQQGNEQTKGITRQQQQTAAASNQQKFTTGSG
jgi:hypothetical protein